MTSAFSDFLPAVSHFHQFNEKRVEAFADDITLIVCRQNHGFRLLSDILVRLINNMKELTSLPFVWIRRPAGCEMEPCAASNYVSSHPFLCCAITLCRYYAIAAPLHYAALVSPRRVAVGLAASWTGALLLCLPPFSGLVPPYRFVYTCYINHYHSHHLV